MTALAACRTCGTEPLENARFCHACGSPVAEVETHAEYKQVTVLFADRLTCMTGAPHSLQNLEFDGSSVPHDPHGSPAAVSASRLLSSTSVSFHRWSTMSVISPCHLRHEVLRPSYVVYFETSGF
jgi:hypothetical protein